MSSPDIKLMGPRGGAGPHDGWMAQFLRAEIEKQAAMVVRVRERVERALDNQPEGLPSKETMRAARFAQDGLKFMAELQIQHAKLELDALRITRGQAPMTDDEYQAKLQGLGRDALDTQSVEELEAAIVRKRALPIPSDP